MKITYPDGYTCTVGYGSYLFPRYVNGHGPSRIDFSEEETIGVFKKKHESTYLYELSKLINTKHPYYIPPRLWEDIG